MENGEFFTPDGEKTVDGNTSKKTLMISNHKKVGIIVLTAAAVGLAVLAGLCIAKRK